MQDKTIRRKIIWLGIVVAVIATAVFPVFSASETTVTLGYSSFEEPLLAPSNYTDLGDALADHALSNNANEPSVNFTSVGAELGFSSTYINSRNSSGLTDGDDVGVTDNAASYPDGSQGFQLSDIDGKVIVTMDAVDISGVTSSELTVQYFLQSTSWETSDVVRIWVVADGSTELDLLDTTSQDIDSLGIEGSWNTLTQDLTGYDTAVLKFAARLQLSLRISPY